MARLGTTRSSMADSPRIISGGGGAVPSQGVSPVPPCFLSEVLKYLTVMLRHLFQGSSIFSFCFHCWFAVV